MMDLDEAIQHCEEVAKEKESHGYCDRSLCVIMDVNNATCDECEAVKCRECASEHRQLAEWLKELKAYRNKSEIPTSCDDAVSRQAVFEQIAEWIISGEYGFTNATDYLSKKIKALPPITPRQRIGQWERMSDLPNDVDDRFECSRCGNVVHYNNVMNLRTFNRWCGRCGSYNG